MLTLDNVKGVIFDLDGTLLNSSIDFRAMKSDIGCPTDQDVLTYIDNLICPIAQAKAHQIVIEHELADAERAGWIEEGRTILERAQALNLPTAIVTRNCRAATAIKLRKNSVPIDVVLTREDAPPKPRPDALLMISSYWQLSVSSIVYVGDYIYDQQAAENAGMKWHLIG